MILFILFGWELSVFPIPHFFSLSSLLTFTEIGFTFPSEPFFIPLSSVSAFSPLNQVNESSAISGPLTPDPWVEAQGSGLYTKIDYRLWVRIRWHWKHTMGSAVCSRVSSHILLWPPQGKVSETYGLSWKSPGTQNFLCGTTVYRNKNNTAKHLKLWKHMQRPPKIQQYNF